MSSDLIECLAKDIIAEQEAKWQAQEAKWQARLEAEQAARLHAEREVRTHIEREAQMTQLQTERETLASMVSLRFPDAPMRLTHLIAKITDVSTFQGLRADIPDVPDLAALEQRLPHAAG